MINRLKKIMREEQVSSDQLAKRLDVTVATVNNWKKIDRLASDTIESICNELGRDINDVFIFEQKLIDNPALMLVEELGSNVHTITYDAVKENWTITYKSNLKPDEINNDFILDFLRNA